MGLEKPIIENLTKSSDPLLPAAGVDEEKITRFFQVEDRGVSAAEDAVIEEDKAVNSREDKLAVEAKLSLDRSGVISSNKGEIGYLVRKTNGKSGLDSRLSYTITDVNKIPVAKIDFSGWAKIDEKDGFVVLTYDGKSFPIKRTKYTSDRVEEDKLASRAIKKLYANGYTLGDMSSLVESVNKENEDVFNRHNKEAEDLAKEKSANIYDQQGYVVDKSGNKKDGTITVEFEPIAVNQGEKNVSTLIPKSYGSSVSLTSNGKTETYKAKDDVRFCAGEKCYLGVAGTSSLGGSFFCEILSENNGSYVLRDAIPSTDYYLKLANQPKAVYLGEKGTFGKRKPEKIKKAFDEYMKCPTLDFSTYETNTQEGLIQVLTDYSASCKP